MDTVKLQIQQITPDRFVVLSQLSIEFPNDFTKGHWNVVGAFETRSKAIAAIMRELARTQGPRCGA